MKQWVRILGVVALLIGSAVPAWAAVELSADLGVGQLETEWLRGRDIVSESDSDFTAGILGVGWEHQNFRIDFDYLQADLDRPVAGKDENTLRDLRIGYRFYEGNGFALTALGSYIDDHCGAFEAEGPAFGLGFEYAINPKWSVNGRVGYSPFGVSVQNGAAEYDDAALLPAAVGVTYQINPSWSLHSGYRYYGFMGESRDHNLTSKVDLVSAGISYRFGAGPKARPESVEPSSPESSPVKERQEKINQFLQPVFFDLDCDQIRPDQVGVLQRDLKLLKANADLNIIVAGHADQPGSAGYNQELSLRRAQQVKGWLVSHEIDEGRIFVYAYGKENPYRDKARDHWESDRWVDIYVTDEKPTREAGMRK